MNLVVATGLFAIGVVLVVAGTEWFIEGCIGLAERWRTNAFLLAVLGFGAEPETLAASLGAAANDLPGTALGTVIGSVTFLALAGVGLGGLVAPFSVVRAPAQSLSLALMALAPVGFGVLLADGWLSRVDGLLLTLATPVYGWMLWRAGSQSVPEDRVAGELSPSGPSRSLLHLSFWGGLAALSIGAEILGIGAYRLIAALDLGASLFGTIIVAIAISLEELPRMWVPVRRGHPELAVANAVGTTLFLVSLNPGLLALAYPLGVDRSTLSWHLPWMVAACAGAAAVIGRGGVGRGAGAVLAGLYGVYALGSFLIG